MAQEADILQRAIEALRKLEELPPGTLADSTTTETSETTEESESTENEMSCPYAAR